MDLGTGVPPGSERPFFQDYAVAGSGLPRKVPWQPGRPVCVLPIEPPNSTARSKSRILERALLTGEPDQAPPDTVSIHEEESKCEP